MPKYTALTPIKHDGKKYSIGETVSMSAKQAEHLLAAKALNDGRTDADRLAAERAEAERIAAEQAAAEKAEAERIAAEQAAAEKAEAERIAAEQAAAEQRVTQMPGKA